MASDHSTLSGLTPNDVVQQHSNDVKGSSVVGFKEWGVISFHSTG